MPGEPAPLPSHVVFWWAPGTVSTGTTVSWQTVGSAATYSMWTTTPTQSVVMSVGSVPSTTTTTIQIGVAEDEDDEGAWWDDDEAEDEPEELPEDQGLDHRHNWLMRRWGACDLCRDREERANRETARRHREAQRATATQRARELLMRSLTDDQQETYRRSGRIFLRGSDGHRYRLSGRSCTGNVARVDNDGAVIQTFCAHPETHDFQGRLIPIEDLLLGQMLLLVHDAAAFFRVANIY